MSNSAWISISSLHNETLKNLKALLKPGEGHKQGVFVVEGLRACEEALVSGGFPIGAILKRDDFELSSFTSQAQEKVQSLLERGLKAYTLSTECFQMISDTVSPQGILLVLKRKTKDVRALLKDLGEAPIVCVLASLRDPGNAGTILRTADALALDAVLATDDSVDLYSPKCVRSQMGALFHIPFAQGESLKDIVQTLKESGFKVYASSGYGAENITKTAFEEMGKNFPVALVIGNEARGLSEEEIKLADKTVFIPMPGRAESFNAAVAAALMMYQAQQSRHKI